VPSYSTFIISKNNSEGEIAQKVVPYQTPPLKTVKSSSDVPAEKKPKVIKSS
jgi:hypothetical protein